VGSMREAQTLASYLVYTTGRRGVTQISSDGYRVWRTT
jgi:hypothetical protein